MAYTLIGEVSTDADTAADFTTLNGGANISGDDDNVQGTGAVGDKMSGSNEILASDNLTSTYNFSSGGTHEGYHIIGWFNTKTPINATTGLQIYVGNASGHTGSWYVIPTVFYKGGFITKAIDPTRDFDTAATWTTTGNPAQLDDVSRMGGEFVMITTIMGNFNNSQVDQFTVGEGIRADVGSSGTPNTFEGVRSIDEDTNSWGWWSSTQGAVISKGKLYIGPSTGTTASWFVDTAFKVIFADELVATGFYEFSMRGTNTTCDWSLANISSANPSNANNRWYLTLDSAMGDVTGGFTDTNGTWSNAGIITLNSNAVLTGTTFIDCNSLIQTSAILSECTVLDSNTADGVAFITSNNPTLISDCSFTFSDGHAIEITTAGTYTFTGNTFAGYSGTPGSNLVASSGSNDAMIYNSSGGLVTINVSGGGDTPSVRNAASSTTQVNNNKAVTISGLRDTTEIRVMQAGSNTVELDGTDDATTGTTDDRSFTFSLGAGTSVDIYIVNKLYENIEIYAYIVPSTDTTLPQQQRFDRSYLNN